MERAFGGARTLFGMRDSVGEKWEYEVSDCVLVFVSGLTLLPGPVVASALISNTNSEFRFCVSRTLSLSEKRGASGTLVCDQKKRQA